LGRNRITQQKIREPVARIPRVKRKRSQSSAARGARAVTDDRRIARNPDEGAVDTRLERVRATDERVIVGERNSDLRGALRAAVISDGCVSGDRDKWQTSHRQWPV